MVVTLLATAVTVLAVLWSIYSFRLSARSPVEDDDSAHSDQQTFSHSGVQKQGEISLRPIPSLGVDRSILLPSSIPSGKSPPAPREFLAQV